MPSLDLVCSSCHAASWQAVVKQEQAVHAELALFYLSICSALIIKRRLDWMDLCSHLM